MKIKTGNYYSLRNGSKYICYSSDTGTNDIHGAVLTTTGKWDFAIHQKNGDKFTDELNSEYDIVSEWKEILIIDNQLNLL